MMNKFRFFVIFVFVLSFSVSCFASNSIPVSGAASSDPTLIGVDYADPDGDLFLSVLYELLGAPVVAYHYRYNPTGNTSASPVFSTVHVSVDWHWIGGLCLLALVLYCLFRLGGMLFCPK